MKTKALFYFLIVVTLVLSNCKPEELLKVTKVQTGSISDITATSAAVSATFIDLGNNVSDFGHCWSTFSEPTLNNGKSVVSGIAQKGDYTSDLSGLSPNTKYYVKAYAIDGEKQIYGKAVDFITLALPPNVITQTAVDLTGISATLKGTINANGESVTVSFEWGTSTADGNTINATPGTVSGNSVTLVNATLTGLIVGTTYHYRLKAEKTSGVVYGEDFSFTTNNVPTVSTNAISNVTQTTATSGGNVSLDGGSPVTARGVCWRTSQNPSITDNKTIDGVGTGSFSSSLAGLVAGTVYYVKAYATNSTGTAYGNEVNFMTEAITSKPPTAAVSVATLVTNTTATFNGAVNAKGNSTTVTFEYGLTDLYGSTVAAIPGTVTGEITTSISVNVTGLIPGTPYHFRVKAESAGGIVYSPDQTFTTLQFPVANTLAATSVTTNSAILNGSINATNLSTTVTFEFGTSISYGYTYNATPNPVTGNITTSVSASRSSLTPGTTYHYRVKAVSSGGTTYGDDQIFTTVCSAPIATSSAATSVANTTTTLNGTVNANGSSTTVTFEYGTTSSYGSTITAAQSPVTGTSSTAVSAAVTGLYAGILYHFRVKSVNCGGTTYGADQTFTTSCSGLAPSAVTKTGYGTSTIIVLNGTINANGCAATATFEYTISVPGMGTNTYTVNATPNIVTGNSDTNVSCSAAIDNLIGISVSFKVKALSLGGTATGSTVSFITSLK